ncbi:hypothetical protein AB0M48_38900 [Lentzea sp. NPDC051208]|uniref:LysM peptidoglycan-binding domain-containing protein n=1 Tax=Lentzea sp. NPDC051208 TaxID=3154642 RepID=UPI0034457F0C
MRVPQTTSSKATLTDEGGARLEFDFNPEFITVTRAHQHSGHINNERPKVSESPYQITNWTPTKFTLSEVVFAGPTTRKKVNQLERWLEPNWRKPGAARGTGMARGEIGPVPEGGTRDGQKVWHLPTLRFVWGARGLNERVELESLNASFTRFTADGMPVRAKVTITLHVMDMQLRATNPTSGGLPGRRATTLVQGQNLQGLALEGYGSPAHWRQLAALNGIEDPLRVRPGTVVYLPNRDELHDGGAR